MKICHIIIRTYNVLFLVLIFCVCVVVAAAAAAVVVVARNLSFGQAAVAQTRNVTKNKTHT